MRESENAEPAHEADDDFTRAPLDAPSSPSDAAHAQRQAQRRRHMRIATLVATGLLLVSVAVSLFVRATSDPGQAVATLLHIATPTPTATVPLGVADIFLSNGAPWGTVTLDGRQLPSAELQGALIQPPQGRHHLDYHARYFPSLRCVFSVPQSQSDTCPLDTSQSAEQFLIGQGVARIINLGSTGATLQPDQRGALKQIVNSRLSQLTRTSVIAVGDRYWDGSGHVVTATAPLHFGLSEALSDDFALGANHNCIQFCPNPSLIAGDPMKPPDVQGWSVYVVINLIWSITDATGYAITSPNGVAGQRSSDTILTTVVIPEDLIVALRPEGWNITGLADLTSQGVVIAASNALDQAATGEGGGDYSASSHRVATNPLDGCVMGAQYHGSTISLLWRFGVLFTIDDAARRVFPQLPTINATEQTQVDDIMAHGTQL